MPDLCAPFVPRNIITAPYTGTPLQGSLHSAGTEAIRARDFRNLAFGGPAPMTQCNRFGYDVQPIVPRYGTDSSLQIAPRHPRRLPSIHRNTFENGVDKMRQTMGLVLAFFLGIAGSAQEQAPKRTRARITFRSSPAQNGRMN